MNYKILTLFFVLNFGALAIGGLFTPKGVNSDWYIQLSKAPWTPPGWVFGAAWFFIMICFSFFMASLYQHSAGNSTFIVSLFALQWVLNVVWNILFFKFHLSVPALADISLLLATVIIFLSIAIKQQQFLQILFISPYVIWLVIAVSLNAFIVAKN